MEAQADYVETVPANVRLINEDRVRISLDAFLRMIEPLITRAEENIRGGTGFAGILEGDICEVEIMHTLMTQMVGALNH